VSKPCIIGPARAAYVELQLSIWMLMLASYKVVAKQEESFLLLLLLSTKFNTTLSISISVTSL
jgi:hypothetical protein